MCELKTKISVKSSQKFLKISIIKKCFCVYFCKKWLILPATKHENNAIEVIVDDIVTLWLNEKHMEE